MARREKARWYDNLDAAEVEPKCDFFGLCSGCNLQRFDAATQITEKEKHLKSVLLSELESLPEETFPVISAEPWHYRYRANFSVKNVIKKEDVLVGFREKKKRFVANMDTCLILPEKISNLIRPLRDLIKELSIKSVLPQINVSCGDNEFGLVLRHLEPTTPEDLKKLGDFEEEHGIKFYLQPSGLDSIHTLDPEGKMELSYRLPDFDLTYNFSPDQFTQINPKVNQLMVRRAIEVLEPVPGDCIADMFCGIGNFSLALAKKGAKVIGLELSEKQVETARKNAELNNLTALTEFKAIDLYTDPSGVADILATTEKMIIDPPRTGALELVQILGEKSPRMILYVSCSPETLARDAKMLTSEKGYKLMNYGLMDMFPHTGHMEAMALFIKE